MQFTPSLIASLTGGVVEGDQDILITGFGPIEQAGEGDITFLANMKYSHFLYTTKASVVLINEDFVLEHPVSATLIRVKDAYSALAELMTLVESSKPLPSVIEQPSYISDGVIIPDDVYVGAFAYIGKNVVIGRGVKIYPQSYIGDNVEIGENTIIRPGVKIYEKCKIGKRCIIHSGCVIGADGFGFAPKDGKFEKIPQIGGVIISDDVEIGANSCIDRATFGNTVIGEGTKLDNLLQVAHNVKIGRHNVFAAQTGIAGSTVVGDYNRVGGQCGFAGHITIGDNNEFGAQSGIPNSIGSGRRMIGYPVVDARTFARTHVYLKHLDQLFKQHKE
ncbi:MAG: UDP-3-O-(3-hydroxymyristoyl)glucosamine N-acyltransferase [Muribaculaceae bacterium]|nr:UDP-3-O-(3-hydroxymyristoyl)glucosamine N-acyltransferase [Muribaculaceae bacterium]